MAKKKNDKPTTFTFYDGFSDSIERLPDFYSKACFCYDIQQYGAWGVEPTFQWAKDDATRMAVEMAWSIAVPSIKKSVQNHKNSNKPPKPGSRRRGRPRKDEVEKTIEQAAMAAEYMSDDIPDEVIDMIAPIYDEIEVF